MENEFGRVTRIKEEDVRELLLPPADVKRLEDDLVAKHDLRFDLGQVRYLLHPTFYRTEFSKLAELLSQKYALNFTVPEMVKMAVVRAKAGDASGPTPNDRLKEALSSTDGLLFRDGLLAYRDRAQDIERVIRIVNVHSQDLTVTVDRTTREADFVACDLLEAQQMHPTLASFKQYLQGTQYKCTTTLRLGTDVQALFAPGFGKWLSNSVEKEYGWQMAVLPTGNRKKTRESFKGRAACHNLDFVIRLFDVESGDYYNVSLGLTNIDRRWYGSDSISITSQLPAETHLRLIQALIDSLGGK